MMIYLLRHGQTEFNRDGRYQGGLDSALTDKGREQARSMGQRLKALIGAPDEWLLQSSPLGRAVATAEIVREELGCNEIVLEPRVREITLGAWDGLTMADIDGQFPGALDGVKSRYDWMFRAPGGERDHEMRARLRDWYDEAVADTRKRIVVSHGVAGRMLCAVILGTTLEGARKGETPQDSIFRIADGRVEMIEP